MTKVLLRRGMVAEIMEACRRVAKGFLRFSILRLWYLSLWVVINAVSMVSED
jgi:hypothetical protein